MTTKVGWVGFFRWRGRPLGLEAYSGTAHSYSAMPKPAPLMVGPN